jgi:hypothetical protein
MKDGEKDMETIIIGLVAGATAAIQYFWLPLQYK